MRLVAQLAVAFWISAGLLAFSAFAVRTFLVHELGPGADRTSILIYRTGQAIVWAAAVLLAGSVFAATASVAWHALGGG